MRRATSDLRSEARSHSRELKQVGTTHGCIKTSARVDGVRGRCQGHPARRARCAADVRGSRRHLPAGTRKRSGAATPQRTEARRARAIAEAGHILTSGVAVQDPRRRETARRSSRGARDRGHQILGRAGIQCCRLDVRSAVGQGRLTGPEVSHGETLGDERRARRPPRTQDHPRLRR